MVGWVNTPNLDRLAAEGVRFGNCVATSPLCVPMRVTLATGAYPHNNGVWGHIPHTVPADADHWIREIRNLGYRTSLFGKTHLHPHGTSDLRDKEDLLHALGLDDVDEIGGPRASTSGMSHMTALWEDKGLLDAYRDDFKDRVVQQALGRPPFRSAVGGLLRCLRGSAGEAVPVIL